METFPLYGDFTGTLRGLFSMETFSFSMETFSFSMETFSLSMETFPLYGNFTSVSTDTAVLKFCEPSYVQLIPLVENTT